MQAAVQDYVAQVQSGAFPAESNGWSMNDGEFEKLNGYLLHGATPDAEGDAG